MTPQGDQTISEDPNDVPQPLFTLRRRQRLLWTATDLPQPAQPTPGWSRRPLLTAETNPPDPNYGHAELSVPAPGSGTVEPNRSNQVPAPPYRFGMRIATPVPVPTVPATPVLLLGVGTPTYAGQFIGNTNNYPDNRVDDILATDVLSFDVRILLAGGTNFVHLDHVDVRAYSGWVRGANDYRYCNPSYPWDTGPFVFDTWCRNTVGRYGYGEVNPDGQSLWSVPGTRATIPLFRERDAAGQYVGRPIQIRAILVALRIWDPKTRLTRQMTIVQDM
jgi:hypothetical protein